MRRERRMCITSTPLSQSVSSNSSLYEDFTDETEENHYDIEFNNMIDTKTMSLFMTLPTATHVYMNEQNQVYACFLTNCYGQILYCNDIWYKLFGFNKNNVIFKKPKILQGPLTNKDVSTDFTKLLYLNNDSTMKNINYDKDGNSYNVVVSSRRINFSNDSSFHVPYFFTCINKVEE